MKIWESFLPVADPSKLDVVQPDAAWCTARGIEPESAAILWQIRDEVGPIVDCRRETLEWFSFLIHNRDSGVPTDGDGIYIHLRLKYKPGCSLAELPPQWQMTREVDLSREIAGVSFDVDEAWALLGEQSAWLLRLLQALPNDPVEMARNTRQFLHFFSNMAQMRVA